jgi:SAM-dependent methyltransferase
MSLVGTAHANLVFGRRVRVLASQLASLLPKNAKVLDVGCGDGTLDSLILRSRPDLTISGIDVLVRPQTHIPVVPFDGNTIPYPDRAFDVVMFVDVLHHTDDPMVLLREARRVARLAIVLKDHTKDGVLAGPTLRFMDWVGNRHHGVVLPYNYWTQTQWERAMTDLGLAAATWNAKVGLYPWPATHLFDRALHFVAKLTPDARVLKAA